MNFDDAATPGALPCPPVGGGTYQPQDVLAAFNGENPQGTWTLTIEDVFNWDGGSLNSWGLEICMNSTIIGMDELNSFIDVLLYPNPANNQLNIKGLPNGNTNISITDVTGKIILTTNASLQKVLDISNFSSGIYFMQLNNDATTKTLKFVKE